MDDYGFPKNELRQILARRVREWLCTLGRINSCDSDSTWEAVVVEHVEGIAVQDPNDLALKLVRERLRASEESREQQPSK
jgi:hypothetical protein